MSEKQNDYIIVRGEKIEMETKVCEGGCGMKFRAKKGSNHSIARIDCDYVCKDVVPDFMKIREQRMRLKRKEQAKWQIKKEECHQAYSKKVEQCRLMLIDEDAQNIKFDIAQKAIDVCFSSHDSRERKTLLKGLSAYKFAREIGLDPKTLSVWMRIKSMIINKLGWDKYHQGTYSGAVKAIRIIEPSTPKEIVEKIFFRKSNGKTSSA